MNNLNSRTQVAIVEIIQIIINKARMMQKIFNKKEIQLQFPGLKKEGMI
jgi:hypothetical protein